MRPIITAIVFAEIISTYLIPLNHSDDKIKMHILFCYLIIKALKFHLKLLLNENLKAFSGSQQI